MWELGGNGDMLYAPVYWKNRGKGQTRRRGTLQTSSLNNTFAGLSSVDWEGESRDSVVVLEWSVWVCCSSKVG
jgi:hypothetical protein